MKFIDRIKHESKRKHKGFGGMIFMLTSIISATTMLYSVTLSWNSNAVAMADNIAYITTVNAANQLYLGNVNSFTFENTENVITTKNGYTIDPAGQYTKMLNSSKLIKTGTANPKNYKIIWNKEKGTCSIQFSGFTTTVGDVVIPHVQEAVIENN